MVRSSGHHRKRSLSRSLSPSDHKRVKSSYRDREKERSRRRSRSRERVRRSRSRDRKIKEKRPSESRVRSKPLKLKRRSRSRSRSREHTIKKEEKKEVKADDEPFDPTNLDKPKNIEETVAEEDWIVTDMVQENSQDEDNDEENMQENDIDENSFISNQMFNVKQNNYEDNRPNNESSETFDHRSESRSGSESLCSHISNRNHSVCEKRSFSFHSANGNKYKKLSQEKLFKNKVYLELKQARELHELKMKNEMTKHNAEMKLIKLQTEYWLSKHPKSSVKSIFAPNSGLKDCVVTESTDVSGNLEMEEQVTVVLTDKQFSVNRNIDNLTGISSLSGIVRPNDSSRVIGDKKFPCSNQTIGSVVGTNSVSSTDEVNDTYSVTTDLQLNEN